MIFSKSQQKNRRGAFRALAVGISHGGGQTHPKMLNQDDRNRDIIEGLLNDEGFQRISRFTAGSSAILKKKGDV